MQQSRTDRVLVGVVLGALALLLGLSALVLVPAIQPIAQAPGPTSTPPVSGSSTQPRATSAATATASEAATAIAGSPTLIPSTTTPATDSANVPNVRVSNDEYTAHSEVTLAQNPRDRRNLIGASKMFTDNANYVFRIGTYASFDGGKTWIDGGQLPGLEQFGVTSDPSVVFDSAGTAYVEVLAARGADGHSALYLYTSRDGGRNWSAPQIVNEDRAGFNDKEWLATDRSGGQYAGQLYTAWVQIVGESYRIRFARSEDGGANWSAAQNIAGDEHVTRQGPIVSVDGAGNVYLLWVNLSTERFETAVSRDGGVSFEPVRTGLAFRNLAPLNGNLRRGFVLPSMVTDPTKPDTLYLIWDDGRGRDGDVLFSVSRDGGQTWPDPVVVNTVATNDQFQPWLAVAPDSTLYLQWFDRRADRANLLVETYAARSTDDGVSWSELRVTDVASDPTVGLPMAGESGFYGDYQGLVADGDAAYLLWNETRDGSQQVYAATIPPNRWNAPVPASLAAAPGPSTVRPAEAEEEEGGD